MIIVYKNVDIAHPYSIVKKFIVYMECGIGIGMIVDWVLAGKMVVQLVYMKFNIKLRQ